MSIDIACYREDHQGVNRLVVDFNKRLQHRGTDFELFANTGYTPSDKDGTLLKTMISSLLTDDSGVTKIRVKPFSMTVEYSIAIEEVDIRQRVIGGIRRATGMTAIVRDRT